jgi:hypothetical protein
MVEEASNIMKWRVIIRVKFSGDSGSVLRKQFAKHCEACEIRQTDAGTWESPAVDPVGAAQALSAILNGLANHASHYSRKMEHFWVYLDRVKDDEQNGSVPRRAIVPVVP